MKFITHMKLDPDEIVSVEDIAPPSEDGTVVLTPGSSVQCDSLQWGNPGFLGTHRCTSRINTLGPAIFYAGYFG